LTDDTPTTDVLERLVAEHLMARTEGLSAPALAAFVSGWTSVLELLRRTDLTLAGEDPRVVSAVGRVIERVEQAQRAVLQPADDAE
jgi:hypothetical protein